MKRFVIVAIIAICSLASFNAYSDTRMRANGSTWTQLSRLGNDNGRRAKTMFVKGIYEGAWAVDPDMAEHFFYRNLSFKEIVNGVDDIYSDFKNSRIPISEVLRVIGMQIAGYDKTEISKVLGNLRFEWGRGVISTLVPKAGEEEE